MLNLRNFKLKTLIMKTRLKIKFTSIFSIFFTCAIAQMNYLAVPPSRIDVQNNTLVSSPLTPGNTTQSYGVSNGAYGPNGNLLFYVVEDRVLNPSGQHVDFLGGLYAGNCQLSGADPNYRFPRGEVAIVPVPGTCNDYYVISIKSNGINIGQAFYSKVNVNGSVITVTNQGQSLLGYYCNPNTYYMKNGFPLAGLGGNPGGLAVSKVVSGNGVSAKRFLYLCGSASGIVKYEITNAGIQNPTYFGSIPGITPSDYGTFELELSTDGKYLAFSNYNQMQVLPSFVSKVFIVELNTAGNYAGNYQQYNLNAIKGLEFDDDINNTSLYVAGGTTTSNVLARIFVNNSQPILNIFNFNLDFSNTFLERAKNGNILALTPWKNNAVRIIQINPISNNLSAFNVNFRSQHQSLGNVFTLPDQIDGEYYNVFTGQPPVVLSAVQINNQVVSTDCKLGNVSIFYNCAPIVLSAFYQNNVSAGGEYKIEIKAMDNDCGYLIGRQFLNYNSGWTNGAIPLNLDLSTLIDANANSLSASLNYHEIIISVRDACGNITTKTIYIDVLSTITPQLNLEIYNTNFTSPANTYLPASTNPSSPIISGAYTSGFRFSGSTGNITGYNITIDQVNNNGVFVNQIYNKTFSTNNVSSVSPLSLNTLCVDAIVWGANVPPIISACSSTNPTYNGYTGYFGYLNGLLSLGNYYKISVTLNNPCSNSSAFSYIYINGLNKPSQSTSTTENVSESGSVLVFPNPAKDNITFKLGNLSSGKYSIYLFDLAGKKVATIAESQNMERRNLSIDYDTKELPNGVYSYVIKSNAFTKNGIVNILK